MHTVGLVPMLSASPLATDAKLQVPLWPLGCPDLHSVLGHAGPYPYPKAATGGPSCLAPLVDIVDLVGAVDDGLVCFELLFQLAELAARLGAGLVRPPSWSGTPTDDKVMTNP